MDPLEKTREELLSDLESLRKRLANLEIELTDGQTDLGPILNPSDRVEERECFEGEIEFEVEAERLPAKGVNSSPGGVCFKSDTPMIFKLRIHREDGGIEERRAQLVWANRDLDLANRLGFEFIDEPDATA